MEIDAETMRLTVTTADLLREIGNPAARQKDVANVYALAIATRSPVDIGVVNRAIVARWPKGLDRVKTIAWKLVKERCSP